MADWSYFLSGRGAEREQALRGEVEYLRGQLEAERLEVRRLTDLLVELKREGFHPAVAFAPPETPEPERLPEEVERAITSRASPGSELYRLLVDDAWTMLKDEQREPEDVARITRYGSKGFHG